MSHSSRILRQLRRVGSGKKAAARGRDQERSRRVFLTLGSGAGTRVIQLFISLVMVRVLLDYLGVSGYGVWAAISAVVHILGLLARGIGDGMIHHLAEAEGKDDLTLSSQTTSTALAMLGAVSLIVGTVAVITYPVLNWSILLNLPSTISAKGVGRAMTLMLLLFAFNLVANLIPRIQFGLQMGYVAAVWQVLGSIASLIAVFFVIAAGGGFSWLVLATVGIPGLMSLINGGVFFGLWPEYRRLIPRFRLVSKPMAVGLLQVGGSYLLFQILLALSTQMDNLLTIHILGASAVTELAVPMKLLAIVNAANALVLAALWPAFKDALTREDHRWLQSTFKRTLSAALLFGTFGGIIIAIAGRPLIQLWVGSAVVPSSTLLIGLGFLAVLLSFGVVVTSILNAANLFLPQIKFAAAMLVATAALKTVSLLHVGIDAMPWAMAVSYLGFYLVPAVRLARRGVLRGPVESHTIT